MAYTTIDDPSAYFQTTLYTGNGSTNVITNSGNSDLSPNWVWIKKRSATENHAVYDTVRGATKTLYPNLTEAEYTESTSLTAFGSDGFTLGADGVVNANTGTYVSWQWKEASISKFDILTYEGSGSAQTISHNLGVKPDWIMVKNIDSSSPAFNWRSYHSALGAGIAMKPNGTDVASDDPGYWNDTEPTSSVFSVKDSGETNNSGQTYIAYLFADVKGYSRVGGSYIGNGNVDGSFIFTGHKSSFLMIKRTDSDAQWRIWDNKRNPINPANTNVQMNEHGADGTDSTLAVDFLSNGIKLRNTEAEINNSGSNFIYFSFAENPFVTSTGVPTTAR